MASFASLSGMLERLEELSSLAVEVSDVAEAAIQGGLDDAQFEVVKRALARLRAALRARMAASGI